MGKKIRIHPLITREAFAQKITFSIYISPHTGKSAVFSYKTAQTETLKIRKANSSGSFKEALFFGDKRITDNTEGGTKEAVTSGEGGVVGI